MKLRYRRAPSDGKPLFGLHDPLALEAQPGRFTVIGASVAFVTLVPVVDLVRSLISAPQVIPSLILPFIPYATVLGGFAVFVVWNGGIVLGMWPSSKRPERLLIKTIGDKSNHMPSFHVPQLYYFIGFSSILGWPVFITGQGGLPSLLREVWARMFGSKR